MIIQPDQLQLDVRAAIRLLALEVNLHHIAEKLAQVERAQARQPQIAR